MTRESLLDQLKRDEIEAVLQGLEKQLLARGDDALQEKYNALSARYHQNRDLELGGLEDRDTLNLEYNRIRNGLFQLIGQAFAPQKSPSALRAGNFLTKWRWPLGVLGISLLLYGISLLPVRQFAFDATLKCSSLEVRLSDGWPKGHNFPASRIDLYGVETWRDDQGRSWDRQRDGGDPVLNKDSATIELEEAKGPQTLTLGANSGILTLSFKDETRGKITWNSAGPASIAYFLWTVGPGGSIAFQPRNTPDFDAIQRLRFDTIAFMGGELGSEDKPVSTIQSGKLQIQGKKEPLQLKGKDYLVLERILQGDITVRQSGDSSLEVEIHGIVRRARSGLHKPLAVLNPSLLETFYSDQRLLFLLTAFGNLVAFLWTILNALGLLQRTP